MATRVLLFLATNLLVVLTVSLILGIVLPAFGIQVGGSMWGLAIFCGLFGMVGAFVSLAISRWSAKRAYRISGGLSGTRSGGTSSIPPAHGGDLGRPGKPVY